MKVDTMRRIDFWAGVPLCFLATGLVKLSSLFAGDKLAPSKRAAFVELSEMGSAIIADPAMRKLAAAGAETYFVIFKSNAGSLDLLNTIPKDRVFTIRADGLVGLAVDTLRFFFWTRSQKIDTIIDLELFSRYSALLTGLSGARKRIGFHAFHNEGLYRGELLSHRVAYNPHQHIAKNFVALVDAALATDEQLPYSKRAVGDDEIRLHQPIYSAAELDSVSQRVRAVVPHFDRAQHRLVLLNPNASDLLPQRRWAPERFAELAKRVADRWSDAIVLLTGAPPERDYVENVRQQAGHERVFNFAGGTSFRELPHLYTISAALVTNDSGPGHFSAVTPLPSFVLFGPETPALYGSLGNSTPIFANLSCSPCVSAANHRKTACNNPVCLSVITVDEVFGKLAGVLG